MSRERINKLIDAMLQKRRFFNIDSLCSKEDDLESTCFSFLISRCILRLFVGIDGGIAYTFSKPGREIMDNDVKRSAFVEEFLKFYGDST